MVYRKLRNLPSHMATERRSWPCNISLEFKSYVIFPTSYYLSMCTHMNINMNFFRKMNKSTTRPSVLSWEHRFT